MSSENFDTSQVLTAIESLREEVASLHQRVAALEAIAAEELNEELVMAISAAVAAYLGVKPHIRQIRLVGSGSWAHQGRATIQASHQLAVRHN